MKRGFPYHIYILHMIDETKKAETNKRKRERERFSPVVSETQKIASHAAMGEKERERKSV